MTEVWACLVDFPGYEISTFGRVRNLKSGRILRPTGGGQGGYSQYHLFINKRRTICYVHRLVASTFIDPNIEGFDIDHLDNNPKNNHLSNLEIVTRKINMHRSYERGRTAVGYPRAVRIVETGEKFISRTDCARVLDRCEGSIRYALKHGTPIAGYHIKEA